jgi:hypothetical protein
MSTFFTFSRIGQVGSEQGTESVKSTLRLPPVL